MAVLLMTDPSGARLPSGKQTVDVRPRLGAHLRRHDHVVRIDAVAFVQLRAQPRPSLGRFPRVELRVERHAADRQHAGVEQAQAAQVQHHFRHAAGQETPAPSDDSADRSAARRRAAAPAD